MDAPAKETLASRWECVRYQFIREDTAPDVIKDIEQFFYAGAAEVISMLHKTNNANELIGRLRELAVEIQDSMTETIIQENQS